MQLMQRNALSSYFFVGIMLTILFASIILVFYIDRSSRKQLAEELKHDIHLELQQRSSQLLNSVTNAHHVLNFFHATPPISAIPRSYQNDGVDPVDKTPISAWYHRIETIFVAYMENNEHLDQVRIIRFDDEGNELVRVQRTNQNIWIAGRKRLQKKADSDYFKEALNLKPGQIYVSPINLNREWGEIQYPYQPTYRMIRNIYDDNNEPFGFLIVNIDAGAILERLADSLPLIIDMYLVNDHGGAIIHPDSEQAFKFEFDPEAKWNNRTIVAGEGMFVGLSIIENPENRFIFLEREINLSPVANKNKVTLVLGFDEKLFWDELAKRRSLNVIIIVGLVGILLIALLVYQRWLNRRFDLAQKEATFKAIVDDSSDAIISTSKDGQIASWNHGSEDIFGYTERKVVGKAFTELLFADKDRSKVQQRLERVFTGTPVDPFESEIIQRGKNKMFVSISISPIVIGDDHTIGGAAAIIRDITAQKVIEQKVVELNVDLENQVAARTHELEEARNEALELSQVKSDFIANVSHEIRTPLNGVIGMLHLIEKDALSELQKKYLKMANSSASSLATLIDDILDLSKIEAGKLDVEDREFDLVAAVNSICLSMSISANNKGLDIVCDLAKIEHPYIVSDDTRIRQILINLINNSIKFTSEGKIIVSATSNLIGDDQVKVDFSVKDTGVGIAKDKQKKLFQSFSQEDSSTSRKYGGTGLGLAICKKLTEILGGEISLESEKDVGTTFNFSIVAGVVGEKIDYRQEKKFFSSTVFFVDIEDSDVSSAIENILSAFSDNVVFAKTDSNWPRNVTEREKHGAKSVVLCQTMQSKQLIQSTSLTKIILVGFYKNLEQLKSLAETKQCILLKLPFISTDILELLEGGENSRYKAVGRVRGKDGELFALLKGYTESKVLLVDDNDINLEVGRGIMEDFGLGVHTANSGENAIRLLQQESFDLVFMDCQMPEMNGFDTTKKIREQEKQTLNSAIPIIAMTANAMSGSRDECIASGMNDFIPKPIDPSELAEKILFWLQLCHNQVKKERPESPSEFFSSVVEVVPNVENETWDQDDALNRFRGRTDRLVIMIDMFLETMPERIKKIASGVEAHDYDLVASTAHEIKGISGNIGGLSLFALSNDLELVAKGESNDSITELAENLKVEYDELESRLSQYKKSV